MVSLKPAYVLLHLVINTRHLFLPYSKTITRMYKIRTDELYKFHDITISVSPKFIAHLLTHLKVPSVNHYISATRYIFYIRETWVNWNIPQEFIYFFHLTSTILWGPVLASGNRSYHCDCCFVSSSCHSKSP